MVGGSPRVLSFFHHLTGRHDIAEILLKVALNTKHQIKSNALINRSQVVVAVDFEQTRKKKESKFIYFFQGKIHRWDASAEDECEPFANIVQRVHILFCTPQSLCNYLDEQAKMKVSLNDFSLIVLDECHHTIGKGPFNEIMSYYRRHKYGPQSNRIPQVIF